jgi:NTE family protein
MGKDAYVEKPLAMTMKELIEAVDSVKKFQRVVQCGTQIRSYPSAVAARARISCAAASPASAAIPIVFPPVRLMCEGRPLWFGDGGLRLVNPLSPAIRLGATRVFAVGVRSQSAAASLSRAEQLQGAEGEPSVLRPPLAQICGVFLNAIFLDHLDADIDHLRRMNELLAAYGGEIAASAAGVQEPMRMVAPLVVSPSHDLAIVAKAMSNRMPGVVRYILEGLGTPDAQSADLMSYLLFDRAYTRALVDIGYQDAGARIDEIEAFVRGGDVGMAEPVLEAVG